MPLSNNTSSPSSMHAVASPTGRMAVATRAGWVSALTCVALYSQGPVAATPSGPIPAALDQTVIEQLAMPSMQAEPPAQRVAETPAAPPAAAASPSPGQPAEASAAVVTGSDIMKALAESVSETDTAAPRPVGAGQGSYAGQPAPLDMEIIRGLAMPAQVPVAALPEPTAATTAPTEPDTTQQSEQAPGGGTAAVTPTVDSQVAVSQRLAGVESNRGGLAPAARRPAGGQPSPLNVDVIRGLASDSANPVPRP